MAENKLKRALKYDNQVHEGAANDITNHIVKLIETIKKRLLICTIFLSLK